jgi:flagellar hook-associated protein 3 FlgL
MNSILNSSGLQFVNTVDNLQQSLSKVEGELSSGLAVAVPSDAPDQVSPILQLHANIQQNQQIQDDLTIVQAQAQTADQNLSTATTILNQVATLASEGGGLDPTTSSRSTMASQVASLLQQLVSITNTNIDGSYIFGGDMNQSPSYQFDSATNTATRLQVTGSTAQAQDGSGGTFATGLSANQIFDARDATDTPIVGQNVFSAISAVITALKGNSTSALQTALSNVQSAGAFLSQQQSFYGNVETNVTSSLANLGNQNLSFKSDLSSRQDANEASAILEMQQYNTTLQSALAAQAKIPRTTLFDLIQ